MVHYRQTKQGQWVVCGPTSVVRPGATVTVHKRDGSTKEERILTTGKPFYNGSAQLVYGYIDRPQREARGRRSQSYECAGCAELVRPGEGICWETGLAH